MKIRNLVGAVLLAGTALTMTSTPAQASHTEVCLGLGVMTTSPLYYPVGPNGGGGTFSFTTPAATTVCTGPSSGLDASGSFHQNSYCGHWTAQGTINGHNFTWEGEGTVVIIEGTPLQGNSTLAGGGKVIPDATTGQSCLNPEGATKFFVFLTVYFVA